MSERLYVFDTTLRDGEQAGHKMSSDSKLAIAHKLDELGVDIIEAGFPISSPGDASVVTKIAKEVRRPIICALARTQEEDVDAALKALETSAHPRVHVFIATSDIHVEKKLRKTKEEVIEMATRAIERAKRYCDNVEFSPEDASRTSEEYLIDVVRAAIAAGATTINIPDTVGYTLPGYFGKLIEDIYRQVPRLKDLTVSVHCHNDLGLAVANTLSGVEAGARQVEGCFLGIGERAGNVSLEEVIMALKTHENFFNVTTNIQTEKIGPACRFIAQQIGYPIPMHKPIIGSSVFSHSSGIHRDGVIKERTTYEIMRPQDVGWVGKELELVSHLGRNGLADYLSQLGYDGSKIVDNVYPIFIELADRKAKLTNDDLHMIVQELRIRNEIEQEKLFNLNTKNIVYGPSPAYAYVTISRNRIYERARGSGQGPIDAVFAAIKNGIQSFGIDLSNLTLEDWTALKGQGGPEAIAWCIVRVSIGERIGIGRSGNPDTVKASALAFLYAINHALETPVP